MTAGVTGVKPALAILRVPTRTSSPSVARPQSSLFRVARLVTVLPGSGTGRGPGPSQAHVPCRRAAVASPPLPAFLVGTPGPGPGSVPALTAPTPSVSLACSRGLRPGPAHGAGPLIRRSEASDARPLLDPVRHWTLRRSPAASVGLQARGAASRLRRPAARNYQSLWLAGPVGDSLAISRASRRYPVLAHGPLVAPAVSTRC